MHADRLAISDELWEKIEPLIPGKAGDPGVTARNNRRFIEAVLWRVRTRFPLWAGSPWRDLPKEFGKWNSPFKRFRRWAKNGVFESLFNAVSGEPDLEYALIDGLINGTIVQAHQKASGAKKGTQYQAIGRSRGGLTTKVVALVDALGKLLPVSAFAGTGRRHEGGRSSDQGGLLWGVAGRQSLRRRLARARP